MQEMKNVNVHIYTYRLLLSKTKINYLTYQIHYQNKISLGLEGNVSATVNITMSTLQSKLLFGVSFDHF